MTNIEQLYAHIQDLTRQNVDNILLDMIEYGTPVTNGLLSEGTLIYVVVPLSLGDFSTLNLNVYQNDGLISPTIEVTDNSPRDYDHCFMFRVPDGTYQLKGELENGEPYWYGEDVVVDDEFREYQSPEEVTDLNNNVYNAYRGITYDDTWNMNWE